MILHYLGLALVEVLKSLQGWGSSLIQGTVQLLNGVERFSQLAAHGSRRGSDCIQHMLFILGLDLLPGECCAIMTGDRLERNDVTFPEAGDGAVNSGRRAFAEAYFVCDWICDACARRQTHQAEHALDLIVIHYFQERRLFQLDGQALAKRAVEDGISRVVAEIGEDNRVFIRQLWRAVKIKVACGEKRQYSDHGSGDLPGSPLRCFRPLLQILQLPADLRGVV